MTPSEPLWKGHFLLEVAFTSTSPVPWEQTRGVSPKDHSLVASNEAILRCQDTHGKPALLAHSNKPRDHLTPTNYYHDRFEATAHWGQGGLQGTLLFCVCLFRALPAPLPTTDELNLFSCFRIWGSKSQPSLDCISEKPQLWSETTFLIHKNHLWRLDSPPSPQTPQLIQDCTAELLAWISFDSQLIREVKVSISLLSLFPHWWQGFCQYPAWVICL